MNYLISETRTSETASRPAIVLIIWLIIQCVNIWFRSRTLARVYVLLSSETKCEVSIEHKFCRKKKRQQEYGHQVIDTNQIIKKFVVNNAI